jgi:hypothetical protein
MTFHDFREGMPLGGPAEPSSVDGAHAAVGSRGASEGIKAVKPYFSKYMNNVFNPSDKVGCAKIPFSRAV